VVQRVKALEKKTKCISLQAQAHSPKPGFFFFCKFVCPLFFIKKVTGDASSAGL